MKTIATILIALMLSACNTDTNTLNPLLFDSDVPCIYSAPIWLNQNQESGEAMIALTATGTRGSNSEYSRATQSTFICTLTPSKEQAGLEHLSDMAKGNGTIGAK